MNVKEAIDTLANLKDKLVSKYGYNEEAEAITTIIIYYKECREENRRLKYDNNEKYISRIAIEEMIMWKKVEAIQYELGIFNFKNKRKVKQLWKEIELLENILNGGK